MLPTTYPFAGPHRVPGLAPRRRGPRFALRRRGPRFALR